MGALLVFIGCGAGNGFEPESVLSLIDHSVWQLVPPGEDPFWDTVENTVPCPEAAYGMEGTGDASFYEVETTDCNYLTVFQPSLIGVESGDTLKASLWHLPLASLEPAEAKLFVSIAGEIILEADIPIPSSEDVYSPQIVAEFPAPAGSPIVFHVHNHGINSWRFHKFTVTR